VLGACDSSMHAALRMAGTQVTNQHPSCDQSTPPIHPKRSQGSRPHYCINGPVLRSGNVDGACDELMKDRGCRFAKKGANATHAEVRVRGGEGRGFVIFGGLWVYQKQWLRTTCMHMQSSRAAPLHLHPCTKQNTRTHALSHAGA